MSKIFEVVKKNNLIELDDICEVAAGEKTDFQQVNVSSLRGAEPVRSHYSAARYVQLRLSEFLPIFPFEKGDSSAAEQYRIIRTKILHHAKKPRLIAVSSACSGDGKTVTSINIAGSLALKEDLTVLLVDTDLRRPRVAEALGIAATPGLTDVLSGRISFEDAVVRAEQFPNLFILSAGSRLENPAELLDSERWRALIEELRAQFDNVIFDATPVAAVADYELIQVVCDGIVLVARQDHSDRTSWMKALDTVAKDKFLGVVLNCVEDWWLWKTPTYDYYRSSSRDRRASV